MALKTQIRVMPCIGFPRKRKEALALRQITPSTIGLPNRKGHGNVAHPYSSIFSSFYQGMLNALDTLNFVVYSHHSPSILHPDNTYETDKKAVDQTRPEIVADFLRVHLLRRRSLIDRG